MGACLCPGDVSLSAKEVKAQEARRGEHQLRSLLLRAPGAPYAVCLRCSQIPQRARVVAVNFSGRSARRGQNMAQQKRPQGAPSTKQRCPAPAP
ncbi:hypothetical protein NDU88_002369 [Pleurodeles waltl]|uniref:Uncharacterized protein n=1 Tax=Pleurodeles waltl TaxID=8319 RepID=A0AAV7RA30_PLEWA|nr:hypothetical protein NDU88_002369 [Pleurodeles waltl]